MIYYKHKNYDIIIKCENIIPDIPGSTTEATVVIHIDSFPSWFPGQILHSHNVFGVWQIIESPIELKRCYILAKHL